MQRENINIRNVYIDLLNKIKNVEGVDKDYVDALIEVVDRHLSALDQDLSLIINLIPDDASVTNQLATQEDIPPAQVNSDWNATSGVAEILNKPTIPAAQVNSDWNATSGVAEILNKPTIPAAQVNSDWNASSGVAEILNKPTIPAAQVNSDWNATSGVAEILNKPTIPAVHNPIQQELSVTSGSWSYSSLDKYYSKTFTLTTPLNGSYSPTISNIQYTGGPHYNWIRTICGGVLSSDGTTLTIRARQEPPSDDVTLLFIQGWS